jgi:hypothetical protein
MGIGCREVWSEVRYCVRVSWRMNNFFPTSNAGTIVSAAVKTRALNQMGAQEKQEEGMSLREHIPNQLSFCGTSNQRKIERSGGREGGREVELFGRV